MEDTQDAMDQFDERSGSTLEKVSFRMQLLNKESDASRFESLKATMEKSLATLLVISLKLPYVQRRSFADSVLLEAPNLVEFKLLDSAIISVQIKDSTKDWRPQNALDPFSLESADGTPSSLREPGFSQSWGYL